MSDTPSRDDLDPAAALRLAQGQQRAVNGRLVAFVPVIMLGWGVAWIVGFSAMWLGSGEWPALTIPMWVAGPVLGVCIAGASALSIVLGIRSGRGIRSESDFSGIVYGCSWMLGALGIFALGQALFVRGGMTSELAALYYPSAFVFFAGVMYLFSGALWRMVPAVVLGVLLLVIAPAGVFAGAPWHNLVYAIAGGGAFTAFGAVLLARARRERRLVGGDRQ